MFGSGAGESLGCRRTTGRCTKVGSCTSPLSCALNQLLIPQILARDCDTLQVCTEAAPDLIRVTEEMCLLLGLLIIKLQDNKKRA